MQEFWLALQKLIDVLPEGFKIQVEILPGTYEMPTILPVDPSKCILVGCWVACPLDKSLNIYYAQ